MEPEPQLVPPAAPPPVPPPLGGPFARPAAVRQPHHEPRKRRGGPLGTALAAVVAFVAKFKTIILLAPKIKLLATSGTMFVSIGAYSLIWGWTFALGFVVLMLIHEIGHAIQMRREGIQPSAIVFVPFLGAYVGMKQLPDDAAMEARVALAGPLLGAVGAAACLVPYALTGDDYWRALTFVGFLLNLLNLLPVLPFDGGRAMAAMSPAMWVVGFVGLVAVTLLAPNPIMVLILIFAGIATCTRLRARKEPAQRAYHNIAPSARAWTAVVYIGLIAALAYGVHVTHLVRHIS